MLLIYVQKPSTRINYIFKHICLRILGVEVEFTYVIKEFISHTGPKLSYGKQPLGNELFLQSHGLLTQQGFESIEINVKEWEETKCFFSVHDKSALPFDIFSASFYLLSRYEEYLPHVKDEKGRFPVSESLAFKEKFLEQPVVDIWAYKFKKVLQLHFPYLEFPQRLMIIHNVIGVYEPFAFKQKGLFRSLAGYANDFLKFRIRRNFRRTRVLLGFKEDPYNTFNWIIDRVKKSSINLSIFFLLGDNNIFNEGINSKRKKIKELIKFIADYKQVGLIFSTISFSDFEILKKEKKQLENITNRNLISSMNSQYLVNLPEIYRNLVELEIERDFTMVYENTVGFRAGSCTPFLFYDLDYEINTPLIIHPLALTTIAMQDKKDSVKIYEVEKIIASVKEVNGTFSMFFTNKDFTPISKNKVWRALFTEKLQQYDKTK